LGIWVAPHTGNLAGVKGGYVKIGICDVRLARSASVAVILATLMLPEIPLERGTPLELLSRYPERARALADAAADTFGLASRLTTLIAAPLANRASRSWLQRHHNPYRAEIDAMAELLGIHGVHALNVCFEWGCTSGVWPSPQGPVLRRVMDWGFPALGENMVVLHQPGEAGPFHAITWPGVSGVFQGVAQGRFAAAINQAPMRQRGAGMIGDWLLGRVAVKHASGLPPAHLLRQMFEQAPNYETAKRILSETPIAVPAIFILAGPREGCIIERTETEARLREMGKTGIAAANHFEEMPGVWRPRPIDSAGRARCAHARVDFCDDFDWFVPPIANANSRLAFTATAQGALTLMGTAGPRPVTRALYLPAR